ncbi:hypothetical protein [Phenylobacterium sp.]|uniref:hypothetical protein n=1 Tax=Phenylobacterium sp. TaxID=1871053 RepID=UPI0025FBADF0|nr:hypothetical protein [Phenylobacterium sp.]MBX3485752.1 hypothetical protein [Phenylobacterium sp.]
MLDDWLRALNNVELAELRARRLRERYGASAEDECASEIRSFAPDDPRRRRLEQVKKALRWT